MRCFMFTYCSSCMRIASASSASVCSISDSFVSISASIPSRFVLTCASSSLSVLSCPNREFFVISRDSFLSSVSSLASSVFSFSAFAFCSRSSVVSAQTVPDTLPAATTAITAASSAAADRLYDTFMNFSFPSCYFVPNILSPASPSPGTIYPCSFNPSSSAPI